MKRSFAFMFRPFRFDTFIPITISIQFIVVCVVVVMFPLIYPFITSVHYRDLNPKTISGLKLSHFSLLSSIPNGTIQSLSKLGDTCSIYRSIFNNLFDYILYVIYVTGCFAHRFVRIVHCYLFWLTYDNIEYESTIHKSDQLYTHFTIGLTMKLENTTTKLKTIDI